MWLFTVASIFKIAHEPFSVFQVNSSKVELIYQDIEVFFEVKKQEGIISSVFRDTNIINFFQKAYENFDELDKKRVVEVSDFCVSMETENTRSGEHWDVLNEFQLLFEGGFVSCQPIDQVFGKRLCGI